MSRPWPPHCAKTPGRHLILPSIPAVGGKPIINTPLANIWLTLLKRSGSTATTLGDSTGTVDL